MKEDDEQKYFNFPIQLLNGFIKDSDKCLYDILCYSLYAYSNTLDGAQSVRYNQTLEWFGITLRNKQESLRNGIDLMDSIIPRSPLTGISLRLLFDFRQNEKTEFEKICLLAFLSFKSIIGKKNYCKMTNLYFLSRMDGRITAVKDKEELSPEIRKYATEHYTKKITLAVFVIYNVSFYKKTKGFFASTKLDMNELVRAIAKSKESESYLDVYNKAVREAELKLKTNNTT